MIRKPLLGDLYCIYCQRMVSPPHQCDLMVQRNELSADETGRVSKDKQTFYGQTFRALTVNDAKLETK